MQTTTPSPQAAALQGGVQGSTHMGSTDSGAAHAVQAVQLADEVQGLSQVWSIVNMAVVFLTLLIQPHSLHTTLTHPHTLSTHPSYTPHTVDHAGWSLPGSPT